MGILKKLMILTLVFCMVLMNVPNELNFAVESSLVIQKEASVDEIEAGEQYHYTINYSVNNLVKNYQNVVVTDKLPLGMEYISVTPTNDITFVNFDDATNELTVGLANLPDNYLAAGRTGFFQVNVRIKEGNVKGGTVFSNSATISAQDASPTVSNVVNVTVKATNDYWMTSKVKINPTVDPVPGSRVKYRVSLYDDRSIDQFGHNNLINAVLVDQLPSEATFVEASNGGVYEPDNHHVTWDVGSLSVGNGFSADITVFYPEELTSAGMTVINTVSASGLNPWNEPVTIESSQEKVEFTNPIIPNPSDSNFVKTVDYQYRYHGQVQTFYMKNISNDGNVPLSNFVVEDPNLPTSLDYTTVFLPTYPYLAFAFKTSEKDWETYELSEEELSRRQINVSNLVSTGSLTGIRVEYLNEFGERQVEAGFNGGKIGVRGVVRESLSDTNEPVTHGDIYGNSAKLSYDYQDENVILTSEVGFMINEPKPWLSISKSHDEAKTYLPKDEVAFNIVVKNKSHATGPLFNPLVYDVLPAEFTYIEGSWSSTNDKVNNVTIKKMDFGPNADQTLLEWDTSSLTLEVGQSFTISYRAKINDNTPATITNEREYYNDVYLTTNEHDTVGFWWGNQGHNWDLEKSTISDKNMFYEGYSEFDLDENSIEYLVSDRERIYVNEFTSALVTKWLKGNLDDEYHKYPQVGHVTEGGDAKYRLEVLNDGNVNIKAIRILDIFPHINDTAVLSSQIRESQWQPFLINKIEEGAIVTDDNSYNLEVNYGLSFDKQHSNLNSSLTDPEYWISDFDADFDITRIKALNLSINDINGGQGLAPGEIISIDLHMRAQVGILPDMIAWNSIGVELTTMNDDVLNPTEPIKAGFKVLPNPNYEIGNFVWFDSNGNGLQDDGYDIENAGINGVRLGLFKEVDGAFQKVDETVSTDEINGKPGYYLFPNLYSGNYYVSVIEMPSYYGITSGTSSDLTINNDIDPQTLRTQVFTISGNDYSIDVGLRPADNLLKKLSVDKTVVKIKGNEALASLPANVGEIIEYKFTIENQGDLPLTNVMIMDDLAMNVTGFSFTSIQFIDQAPMTIPSFSRTKTSTDNVVTLTHVEPNEVIVLHGQYKVKASDADLSTLDNTVEVKSNEMVDKVMVTSGSQSSTSTDIVHFAIDKTSREDAVKMGETIHYEIRVTNQSSIPLDGVEVVDNNIVFDTSNDYQVSGQTVTINEFSPGETVLITGSRVANSSDLKSNKKIKNTAKVHHDALRKTIKDTKNVGTYILGVEKVADQPVYNVGDDVEYNIKVSNLGSEKLTDVTIIEEAISSSKNPNENVRDSLPTMAIGDLNKGENRDIVFSYRISEDNLSIDGVTRNVTNNVIVTSNEANDLVGASVSVDIESVKIIKSIADGRKAFKVGDTITYQVEINNTGSVAISNTEVMVELLNLENGAVADIISIATIDFLAPGNTEVYTWDYVLKASDMNLIETSQVLISNASIDLPITGTKVLSNEVEALTYHIGLSKRGFKANQEKPLRAGDQVIYEFEISNLGSATLSGVVLMDDKFDLPENVRLIGDLEAGQTITKHYTYTLVDADLPAPIVNSARVGSNEGVTATDVDRVGGPEIKFTKNVIYGHLSREEIIRRYDEILDSTTINVVSGSQVTYVFTIENIGETYLSNISLVDDTFSVPMQLMMFINELSSISNPATNPSLQLAGYPMNEKVVFALHSIVDETLTNQASVTAIATDSVGQRIDGSIDPSYTSSALVNVVEPTIHVDKFVYMEGEESSMDKQIDVEYKDQIVLRYEVTNNGLIALNQIELVDEYLIKSGYDFDQMEKIAGNDKLMPGEKAIYEIPLMTYESFNSPVVAKGNPILDDGTDIVAYPSSFRVTSDDTVTVNMVDFLLKVNKVSDKLEVTITDEITYTITVSNEGEEVLSNIRVVDEKVNLDTTIDQLQKGESEQFIVKYKTHSEDLLQGFTENIVEVYSDQTSVTTDSATVIVKPFIVVSLPVQEEVEEIIEIPEEPIPEAPVILEEEVIEIPVQPVPLATIEELPQTSGIHSYYLYFLGTFLIVVGGSLITKVRK